MKDWLVVTPDGLLTAHPPHGSKSSGNLVATHLMLHSSELLQRILSRDYGRRWRQKTARKISTADRRQPELNLMKQSGNGKRRVERNGVEA
jgi:hypothetical protein